MYDCRISLQRGFFFFKFHQIFNVTSSPRFCDWLDHKFWKSKESQLCDLKKSSFCVVFYRYYNISPEREKSLKKIVIFFLHVLTRSLENETWIFSNHSFKLTRTFTLKEYEWIVSVWWPRVKTGHNYYTSKEKEHSTLSGIYSQFWFQGMMLFSSVVWYLNTKYILCDI